MTARINAETIDQLDDDIFDAADESEQDNLERAGRAAKALVLYGHASGPGSEPTVELFGDLLTDLHHLADALGLDWAERVNRAERHYRAEA